MNWYWNFNSTPPVSQLYMFPTRYYFKTKLLCYTF